MNDFFCPFYNFSFTPLSSWEKTSNTILDVSVVADWWKSSSPFVTSCSSPTSLKRFQIQEYNCRQYYTLVEQKAILLIFISIVDKNINFRSKWNWRKGQFELIKISIDSSIYSRICLYLDIEKNINWSQSQSN